MLLPSLLCCVSTTPPPLRLSQFESWASEYGRNYSDHATKASRFAKWATNLDFIESHNARFERGLETFTVGMNQFGDLSNGEYREGILQQKRPASARSSQASSTFTRATGDLPDSWSWVDKNVITAVKDQVGQFILTPLFGNSSSRHCLDTQGQCGSCWAFSAVASMESAVNKKANGSVPAGCTDVCGVGKVPCCSFSEQEVADCTNNGKNTCDIGGEMHDGKNLSVIGGQIMLMGKMSHVACRLSQASWKLFMGKTAPSTRRSHTHTCLATRRS